MHCSIDAGSTMICARYGLGEYEGMAFAVHALRPDDLFCDVGANAGVYTILAAGTVGARAIAIEPISDTFDLLMQNVYANALSDRVDAHRNGVGRTGGQLRFTSKLWSFNHVAAPGEPDTVDVEVRTLDDILAGRTPTLLKIDVEGFEAEVLAGAPRALSDAGLKAIIIEVADEHLRRYETSGLELSDTLGDAGFKGPFWYDPEQRKLGPAGEPRERRYNQIFVRDPDAIAATVASAPAFKINHSTH
jgi:FkbM family methyltransferase